MTHHRIRGAGIAVGATIVLAGLVWKVSPARSGSQPQPAAPGHAVIGPEAGRVVDQDRVARVLASMSLRERVAQMLLAYPQLDAEGPVAVGGVLFVGRMLDDLDGARLRVRSATRRARIPPFFAVDMEGGSFNRMRNHPDVRGLPSAQQLAELPDAEVETWGRRVGVAMRGVGLNLNLAPVLDVAATGHMHENGRSFGGDRDVVVAKASAFARGLARGGVVPVGKHFPGYGDLAADTDHQRVIARWTRERVLDEMSVFQRTGTWLGGVMMSNAAYEPYGTRPAMLTPELVGAARDAGWLTVTDDLAIGVLAEHIGGEPEDVLREAFRSGNDLLLTTAPPDWDKGVDYVAVLVDEVTAHPELEPQVAESCRRILEIKDRLGLLDAL